MKKIIIVISFVLLATTSYVFAQTNAKFGYINSAELMQVMPGRDTVEARLTEFRSSLEQTIQTMYQEYQGKVTDYQNNAATMSQIIKQTKEREIQDLEGRIQQFQQTADTEFQKKQGELFAPLTTRAREAIDAVANENGYNYIFDTSTGAIIFFEKGENIAALVKAKLGI
ncbi:MAG: OmpH family outer membrane protein [Bacteroidetes bacterium]|nr:OmpH family outer membrane protein [Bacteroidota bacterium]